MNAVMTNKEEEEEIQDLLEIAKLTWLYTDLDQYNLLHHQGSTQPSPTYWGFIDGELSCGLKVDFALIPGFISRMHTERCPACCEAMGYPKGKGSPKNDDDCRKILGI